MAKIDDLHANVEGLNRVADAFKELAEALSNIRISFENNQEGK